MADKEVMPEVAPTEETESESKESKKGLSKTLIIAVAGIGGLVINGIVAYFFATSFVIPEYFSATADSAVVIIEPAEIPVQVVTTDKSTGSSETDDAKIFSGSEFFSVKHIVINPYGTNGRRFLAMDMSIGVSKKSAVRKLKDRDAEIRDKINTFLSRKTVAELTNIVSKRKIKKDIRKLLNAMLENGEVNEIYFTKYVLQ